MTDRGRCLRPRSGPRPAALLLWLLILASLWLLLPGRSMAGRIDGCDRLSRLTQAQRHWQDGAQAESVTLPDRVPRERFSGLTRARYRFTPPACTQETGLLLPHTGAAYRVLADGQPAQRIAPADTWWLPDPTDDSLTNPRVPVLYRLPAGTQEVQVLLEGSLFIPVGSWALTIGPIEEVAQRQAQLYRRSIDWTQSAGLVVTVVGTIALMLAVVRRQRHPSLVWFTLACAAWVGRGIYSTATTLPLPASLFESGVALLVFLLGLPLAIATLHLLGRWNPTWRRLSLATMVLVLGLLGLGLWRPELEVTCRTTVYQAMLLWMLAQCVMALRHRQVIGHWRGWLLVAGYAALLAGACRDFLLVQGVFSVQDDMQSLLVWGYLVLLMAMAVVGADHVMQALTLTRDLNQMLEQKVAERSAALERSYEQQQQDRIGQARERARAEERERIVREMHDGIGGQLMTALRGVERGAFSQERLAELLQESLDDLRLIIDATAADTRLLPALAAWRHRWDPRLEALGIELSWQVDELMGGQDLPADLVLQLMRILQEAVTNAVKHAQASRVEVHCSAASDVLRLEVADNGRGCPHGQIPSQQVQPGRHGLQSMRTRSTAIGAEIAWLAEPEGGLRVRLELPLSTPRAAAG
ncbi:MAG: ATP-binding protein [Leptothrix sp. (in: Bacteria)]|jgi:signal transduction histidine kinase|nr:ATP-binding protein [Leptothrix sp. (in: b-proteobacteria)]MBP7518926.1 ATP-binding protein [Leptothrix sp. (in: b-proteobacteria)]HQY10069.1 ATP-binding protein [Burkholderiaceae bacterium]